jgi:hypothetical protein
MTKPMIRIVELDGTVIDRELTKEELVQHQADIQTAAQLIAKAEAATAAKAALLDRLGITADEAKLLLS